MQLARVVGTATSTIKHPSMNGWKLLIVQMLDARGGPEGEPGPERPGNAAGTDPSRPGRARNRRSCPFPASPRASQLPMKPVPPVIEILMVGRRA